MADSSEEESLADDIHDISGRESHTSSDLSQDSEDMKGIIAEAAQHELETEGEFGPDFEDTLNDILLERGYVFSDSHVKARYQYVIYHSTYITPQGLAVIPIGAPSGPASLCRRYAPYTLQVAKWHVCRFRIVPELPAVETSGKTLLFHTITGQSKTVLTDGKTSMYMLHGEYRYHLDEPKKPEDEYDMPNNPALHPSIGAWKVTVEDLYKGSIP